MTKEPHLDEDEEKEADEYEKVPSSVIFEAIRREGEHELSRGFSAGISNLGYTVGFLIVILGRMQLFTENTITPILPLFLAPTRTHFYQTARLWGIVFIANLVGCAAAALVMVYGHIVPDARFEGVLAVSRHYAQATAFEHFSWGRSQPVDATRA